MKSIPTIALMALLAVTAYSRPSGNHWDIPCDGYYVAMETVCGGVTAVSDAARVKRSDNATDHALSRQKRNTYDFTCSFDHTICSVGLKESLCNAGCEGYFSFDSSYLYVDAPCVGLFTVVLCKT